MYMHIIDDNDIDLYEILSEKENKRNPKLSGRLAGFSFLLQKNR